MLISHFFLTCYVVLICFWIVTLKRLTKWRLTTSASRWTTGLTRAIGETLVQCATTFNQTRRILITLVATIIVSGGTMVNAIQRKLLIITLLVGQDTDEQQELGKNSHSM